MPYTRLNFGKYRGWLLQEVPSAYLMWLRDTCTRLDPGLRLDVDIELRQRQHHFSTAQDDRDTRPASGALADMASITTTWYRQMAMRFHPDRGGSNEAMKAINEGHDLLRELAGLDETHAK